MESGDILCRSVPQTSERLQARNSPGQNIKGKRIMSSKGERAGIMIQVEGESEVADERVDKLTDQPSQTTVDLSLMKAAAPGEDKPPKKRQSEDLGNMMIGGSHSQIEHSLPMIRISASEALTPKSSALSTPKAISTRDE